LKEHKQTKEPTLTRRGFLKTLAISGALTGIAKAKPTPKSKRLAPTLKKTTSTAKESRQTAKTAKAIDRAALVNRHSPVLHALNPLSPLSVGNGEFAFTADITGLQTFAQEYQTQMPLCTMAQWGWHTTPASQGFDRKALRLTEYDTFGRAVGYATSSEGQTELYNWLRENPHRLHLGQIGLRLTTDAGREATTGDITDIEQKLDLWTGILTSRFKFADKPVKVKTAAHPKLDLLAVEIESPLIAEGRLALRFAFPYGSQSMQAADWQKPERHKSELVSQHADGVEIHRQLDSDEYFASVKWTGKALFANEKAHTFWLAPAKQNSRFMFVTGFSAKQPKSLLPTAAATFAASVEHWQNFWTQGCAVELIDSKDKRALELERRIVLSQYLTAIQCSGSRPPQETGLTVNSWYGKFHLEMHWWHAAHFALWNRLPMLEKSLGWYDRILPVAQNLAKSQGYAGARWPKMVSSVGFDSPSPIGPLLIWQQPHTIFYAELCYQTRRNRQTLARYRRIVFETAEFMASFAHFDAKTERYVLGPPLIPAQENHPPRETWNPTFELAYWAYGLNIAQAWRQRLGLQRSAAWQKVLDKLSPLPVKDGVYLAHENCPQTFTERNQDHPSMLGALGVLSGAFPAAKVDRETMRRTLHRALKDWQWDKTWGWDYPMTAMTAARLGEAKLAVEALLMETEKNRYLPNGHNWQRPNLPCYLPGNGGLLYAVALMAGGWKDSPPAKATGFPADGSWTVRAENFNAALLKEF
jgi:hypothetical protein